ncbi:type VI secretion system protein TssA [Burkholderia vietnamiensis]|uniref:type VI secretion system protein TssA n=1 Tax=Burkholderia vietnamiensis TaxID=60552 RepID=UPI00075DD323|nr:type VI secretion system protein TssA [Burkholderia vietnamiensis]KVF22121.1 type VI secretion protein ImpA [Burkholderia vietnamiensis]KVF62686.1 type VI secretion protein ImpA [Burkholderia vietnamiensis]
MSKKQSAVHSKPGQALVTTAPHFDWLTPVSDSAPCGPDLEYDHDFVILFAGAAPRQDVQYGAFVGGAEPHNWSEIERDCRRLMLRTKDMRVAILYTRCLTRLGGAVGLAEGTELLATWLQTFPDNIHPQATADDDREATLDVRMNALQGLADPDGLLSDVREIVLMKSTATRLQVHDVERAFAHPRPADAIAPNSVEQQLRNLRLQQSATISAFDQTISYLTAINTWCASHLESYLPDLSSLMRLLQLLQQREPHTGSAPDHTSTFGGPDHDERMTDEAATAESVPLPHNVERLDTAQLPSVASRTDGTPNDRQAALALIRAARDWFETNEPSSPVPVLLKRAEQFVGKRYAEAVKAIPADLLTHWDESEGP